MFNLTDVQMKFLRRVMEKNWSTRKHHGETVFYKENDVRYGMSFGKVEFKRNEDNKLKKGQVWGINTAIIHESIAEFQDILIDEGLYVIFNKYEKDVLQMQVCKKDIATNVNDPLEIYFWIAPTIMKKGG